MKTYHIHPENDSKPHNLFGHGCKCQPRVEYKEEINQIHVIHNSFDGREAVEEAKRILAECAKKDIKGKNSI